MAATAKKKDPALWERVKDAVTAGDKGGKPGQWSARKAQLASAEYKKQGGTYAGPKSRDNHLQQWSDEERDTKSGKAVDKTPPQTRASLLDQARAKGVKGASRMRKAELERALGTT